MVGEPNEDAATKRGPGRLSLRLGALLVTAAVGGLALLLASGCPTVVYEGESDFGAVRVTERSNGLRTLHMGAGRARQSAIFPGRPMHLELPYSKVAMVGPALIPPDGRILFVGLGGGAMPMYVRQILPATRIEVVEIDPLIVDLAQRYFGFRPDVAMTVITADGRAFIESAQPDSWDLVVLDAFSDTEIPRALTTREFLESVRATLSPVGIVVSNMPSSNLADYGSMVATYGAVFAQVHLVRVPRRAQRILVAAPATRRLDRAALIEASRALATRVELGFDLPGLVGRGHEPAPRTRGPILEDP